MASDSRDATAGGSAPNNLNFRFDHRKIASAATDKSSQEQCDECLHFVDELRDHSQINRFVGTHTANVFV
jgi:hypothetical protein